MRRIAHLSDVHMLDRDARRSSARYRFATRAVSLGRPIDPSGRARKLARGLAAAKASGADHVVISGDLTELGAASEFDHLADVLADAGLPDDALTIVPGNHDAYTTPGGWKKALAGPLKRWAHGSADEPGKVVLRGDLALLPIDTSTYQSIAFSRGVFSRDAASAVARRLGDRALRDKTVVLVVHHPPFARESNALWSWIDALRGGKQLLDLLMGHPRAQVLHGHLHRVVDRIVGLGKNTRARIFGAPAIVDDALERPRVRLYDVRDGWLESAGLYAL
jgi:3',5'-cyclic AMP phosphodiesterase CpdA